MFYFPDICALGPEILGEHSLSFSSYLALSRLSRQFTPLSRYKEMCNSDSSA